MANRYPLRVRVTNKMVTYDNKSDKFYYRTDIPISNYVKHGYMAYDMSGHNIGIVFSSDDKRTKRYGNSEFLFLASLKAKYGTCARLKETANIFGFLNLKKY